MLTKALVFRHFFQICRIEMVLGSTDIHSVELVAGELSLRQQVEMNLFVITEYQLGNMSFPEKGIMMEMRFKRKVISEMMTTYLPSILLMMITFATTFFKPFFFEAALSVNLTTMLVMTTIFISKDCWSVFCQASVQKFPRGHIVYWNYIIISKHNTWWMVMVLSERGWY